MGGERRFQFSLNALLVICTVAAVVLVVWQVVFEWMFAHVYWTALLVFLAVWGSVQRRARYWRQDYATRFSWAWVLLALSACVLVFWIRYRWVVDDPSWPRPFPYPDKVLMAFHDLLDRMDPPPPGHIKLEGEFYLVLCYLNVLVFAMSGLVGAAVGISFRQAYLFTWVFRARKS